MARPIGVTLIAGICFLGSAYALTVGGRSTLALIHSQSENAGAAGDLAKLTAALIVLVITSTTLYALAGWGLLKLKNWARILTIVLFAVGAAFRVLWWPLAPHITTVDLLATLVSIALYLTVIVYLLKSGVRSHFQQPVSREA